MDLHDYFWEVGEKMLDDNQMNSNLRHRPTMSPGMEDDDDDFSFSPMASNSPLGMQNSSFTRPSPSPFGNSSPFGGGFSPQPPCMVSQQQGQQPKTAEDAFWDGAKGVAQGAKGLIGALQDVFSNNDYVTLTRSTRIMMISSGCALGAGILCMVLSFVLPAFQTAFGVVVGSMLNIAVGLFIYPFLYNKGKYQALNMPQPVMEQQRPEPQPVMSFSNEEEETDIWDDDTDDPFDLDDLDDPFDPDDLDDPDDPDDDQFDFEREEHEVMDVKEAINEIPAYNAGTQTRQSLYENYMRVLPNFTKDFNKMKDVSINSDFGETVQTVLREECVKIGIEEEDIPTVDKITENGFQYCIKFTTSNSKILASTKLAQIADQMALQLMYDSDTGRKKRGYDGFVGTTQVIGQSVFVYISKGSKCENYISIADASVVEKDMITDPKVVAPCLLGVNQVGEVITTDFMDIESLIITGAPRSGKSWLVQSIIAQMCMYMSPKDVIFEALDVKGANSDYVEMCQTLPHFRVFKGTTMSVVERLEYLTTVEIDRRAKILGQYEGIKDIKDLHKYHPEVEMPYLYIIIDEMTSLMSSLDNMAKDKTHKEYADLKNRCVNALLMIASKAPSMGIRGIYIGHRLSNQVMPKDLTAIVPNKILVRADEEEVLKLGTPGKKFKYYIGNTGDMCVYVKDITNNQCAYNHGLCIMSDNKANNDFYKYVGELWKKFEPDFDVHLLKNHYECQVDYRKDPLGKGKPQQINLNQSKPSYTGPLFSEQIENVNNDNIFDDDDFEF